MKFRLLLIFVILIVTISVRLIGINFGLPYATGARPDELVIIRHTLPFGTGDFNPHFFEYPSLFLYLLFIFFAIQFLLGKLLGWYHNPTDFASTVLLNPSPLILIARLTVAIFGFLTVYLVYRTFRDSDEDVGLISATLFSLIYIHVQQSHFGTTDVPMLFFGMLSFLFAQKVFIGGKTRDYITSGIFSGLAASTKYNGAIFLIPLIFAFLLHLRHGSIIKSLSKIFGGILASVISFSLFSPFIIVNFSTFRSDFLKDNARLIEGTVIELGRGWVNFIKISLYHGIGFPLLLFSLLAIIYLLIKRTRLAVFLISFPLTYYLVIGAGHAVYVLYALPIVPFLCIISAFFLKDLFRNLKGIIKPIVLTIVILILLSVSIRNIIDYLATITKKDTRSLAANWIIKNVEANSTVGWVGSAWSVPNLPFSAQEVDSRFTQSRVGISLPAKIIEKMKEKVDNTGYRVLRYDSEKADTDTLRFFKIDQIQLRNIKCLIVTSYPELSFGKLPEKINMLIRDTTKYLFQVQFNPFRGEKPKLIMDKQDASYLPFANFKNIQRPGPFISIYRFKHL
jgi:4-amino-4-deoxy-L-arabinose transferase-like glycosyltransferase